MPHHPEGIAAPRFTGIPTFMRAPFAEDIKDLDIAMAGIPYDGGVIGDVWKSVSVQANGGIGGVIKFQVLVVRRTLCVFGEK